MGGGGGGARGGRPRAPRPRRCGCRRGKTSCPTRSWTPSRRTSSRCIPPTRQSPARRCVDVQPGSWRTPAHSGDLPPAVRRRPPAGDRPLAGKGDQGIQGFPQRPAARRPPGAEDRMRLGERRPLLEHLEEVRRRLGICLAAGAAGAIGAFQGREPLLRWLLAPVGRVVFTTVAEPFLAQLKLAAWGGLLLAVPVILWQLWGFFAAGLRPEERRVVGPWVPLARLLFAAGAW